MQCYIGICDVMLIVYPQLIFLKADFPPDWDIQLVEPAGYACQRKSLARDEDHVINTCDQVMMGRGSGGVGGGSVRQRRHVHDSIKSSHLTAARGLKRSRSGETQRPEIPKKKSSSFFFFFPQVRATTHQRSRSGVAFQAFPQIQTHNT